MTREDQLTDLKSLRTVTGKLADWADLAQKALNHHQVFGSVSQIPKWSPRKSLFSNDFFLGSVLQMSQMRAKFEPNARQILINKPRQSPVH